MKLALIYNPETDQYATMAMGQPIPWGWRVRVTHIPDEAAAQLWLQEEKRALKMLDATLLKQLEG